MGGDSKPFCSVKTTVDEIMFAPDQIWKDKELRSESGNYCGDITVRAEIEREPTASISFAYRWNNVNNWSKGFMRTGMKAKRKRVAFTIERKDSEGKYVPISGIGIFKQESPNFGQETSELFRQRFLLEQFQCPIAKEKTVLKFSICDKKFKEVNAVEFTLVEALQDLKQREGRKFAAMVLEDFKIDKQYHIGHYFSAGWSLGLGFALNFSRANGTIEDTGYLHSVEKPEQNAYLKLMEEFS